MRLKRIWPNSAEANGLIMMGPSIVELLTYATVTLADGRRMHIPMLDFHIEVSPANTRIVTDICSLLCQEGFILNSGKSYHFIGTGLLTDEGLNKFLGKALLFTPIVDEIWIAHQLQEQSCTLRFGEKHGMIPTVIASF